MDTGTLMSKILLFIKLLFSEFINPFNYILSLLIGITINYFQHIPVFSSIVPFIVPIVVQAISKAMVRYNKRHLDLLVKLPAERKDPAFITDNYGRIILTEGHTKKLFREKEIRELTDIFKSFSLQDITAKQGEQGMELYSEILGNWFFMKIKPEMKSGSCLVWMQSITELHNERVKAESMALFGKLNPEPVFRCNRECIIIESNPAANESFRLDTLAGLNIIDVIPQTRCIDIETLIENNEKLKITDKFNDRIFRFMLRGVNHLNICHIYGSDITERVQSEKKIKQQKKSITDSIEYASRIQNAIIPSAKPISKVTSEHFILFKPCQIVSGDFYWIKEINDQLYVVVADCTGHGVPGAFMSMLGIAFLNEITSGTAIKDTATILNELRWKVTTTLSQSEEDSGAADGMDISLLAINKKSKMLQFSGAYNHLLLFRENDPEVLKADRMPIGKSLLEGKSFSVREKQLRINDMLYLFSDGYRDQFGGDADIKFSGKRFYGLLEEIHHLPAQIQKKKLDSNIEAWKGEREQIDDILVVGMRI